MLHSPQTVYAEYPDPRRDEWEAKIRPALNKVSVELIAKVTGLSCRTIVYARTGPRRRQELIAFDSPTLRTNQRIEK